MAADMHAAERSLVPAGTILSCTLDVTSVSEHQRGDTNASSSGVGMSRASVSSMSPTTAVFSRGPSLCLRLALTNEVPIRAVLLFAEGIFDAECFAIHPNGKESAEMVVHISPAKNVLAELFIKVFAGYSIERQLRVFEANQVLPRFVTFVQTETLTGDPPESYITFRMHCRLDQLRQWVDENFVFVDEQKIWGAENGEVPSVAGGKLQLNFVCTRNQEPMALDMDSASGETKLCHNDMQNAADILQSMCANMGIRELQSRAHFPRILAAVQSAVDNMDERYQVNERLAGEFAERINAVRECVVRAEDALAIRNFTEARRIYARVSLLNRELNGHQTVRMAAKKEFSEAVQLLNVSIEQFSRLRVGDSASSLIQECRKAIATDNLEMLPKLLEFGV